MSTLLSASSQARRPALLALLAASGLAACDSSPPPPTTRQPLPATPPPVAEARRDQLPANDGLNPAGSSQRQRQTDFLNRIRQADPQFKTIDRALLNEQNELGLILNRNVSMDSVPALMRAMLAQMAKEFPGQDLTVDAYAPSNPPMKIGAAHLDARTRDMTYTPERR